MADVLNNLGFLESVLRQLRFPARTGDQIDRNLSQLPPEPPTGAGRPAFAMQMDDFWAQGMNFGLQYDF